MRYKTIFQQQAHKAHKIFIKAVAAETVWRW